MIGSVEVRSGDLVLGGDEGLVLATEEEVMAVIDAAEAIQLGGEATLCGDSGRVLHCLAPSSMKSMSPLCAGCRLTFF
jgi:hypothetical protein